MIVNHGHIGIFNNRLLKNCGKILQIINDYNYIIMRKMRMIDEFITSHTLDIDIYLIGWTIEMIAAPTQHGQNILKNNLLSNECKSTMATR